MLRHVDGTPILAVYLLGEDSLSRHIFRHGTLPFHSLVLVIRSDNKLVPNPVDALLDRSITRSLDWGNECRICGLPQQSRLATAISISNVVIAL